MVKRPCEYLLNLSNRLGMTIPPPVIDEVIKQMVLFARDYSAKVCPGEINFEEFEKEIFGVKIFNE